MDYRTKSPLPRYQPVLSTYQPSSNLISTSANTSRPIIRYPESNQKYVPNPVSSVNTNLTSLDSRPKMHYTTNSFPTIPISREPPVFANIYTRPKNEGQNKQKQKIKEVSDDLAKLKKKLQGMIIHPQNGDKKQPDDYSLNRSAQKFYSPNSRIDTTKIQNQRQNFKLNPQSVDYPSKPEPSIKKQTIYYQNLSQKKSNQNKRVATQPNYSYSYANRPTYSFGTSNNQSKNTPIRTSQNLQNTLTKSQAENLQTNKNQKTVIQNTGIIKNQNNSYHVKTYSNLNSQSQNKNIQVTKQKIVQNIPQKPQTHMPNYSKPITNQTNNNQISKPKYEPVNTVSTARRYDYTFKTIQPLVNLQAIQLQQKNLESAKILQLQSQKVQLQAKIDQIKLQRQNLFLQKQKFQDQLNKQTTKYKFLQQKHAKICEQYEQCLKRQDLLRERVMILERELITAKSKNKNNFEDILKGQLQQTSKIKQTIQQKNDQILKLNQIILENRRKAQQAINNSSVDKLKFITQKKQIQQMHQITVLHKQNEIKTLKHTIETMQAKLQVAVKDNKHKDQFLKQHLMGRLKEGQQKEYVNRVLSKYQIQFPINQLAKKLVEEQEQIRYLKQIIQAQNANLS